MSEQQPKTTNPETETEVPPVAPADVPDVGPEGPVADAASPDVAGDVADAPVDAEAEPDDGAVDAEPVPEPEPDWKDRYLRSVAELDNVRKRARRDAAAGEVRGVTRLARELLPALDNLDRALEHVGEAPDAGDDQIVEGLRLIHRELHTALAQAGIESFRPDGQEFDPRFHEALSQQPADEATPAGTVVTVYQAGYRLGDDVLRPAKVVVAG